jgi:hypothetical protein
MTISAKKREAVEKRAKNLCEYYLCPQNHSPQRFSVEHVLAKVKKGSDDLENLALACQTCNNHKYTKTEAIDPFSKEMALLYNPRKDIWEEHFIWSADFSEIIGVSPTGRATVKTLKLNREGVQNLRRLLHLVGKHPPK